MSQNYEQRRTTVQTALTEAKARPAKGGTMAELAALVLDALDHIPEQVR
ncbi:DUF6307 family protein [Kutzneria albida]|uniref:Uncharacterized protein n=1 Tax=Kutzneria albida DSM 43870 TaxID=1449976 RepID=W5W4Z2_9PSEU|nr:DUF6307 family protein [Kutzneria albida]AHH96293.1 hypothetical protein KALB_2925 [Kutzneria albida DSM 43870]